MIAVTKRRKYTLTLALTLAAMPGHAGTACDPRASNPGPLARIDHFVIIFQENWSFDGLYGLVEGAVGIRQAIRTGATLQADKQGRALTALPTPSTNPPVPDGLAARPYDLARYVSAGEASQDIVHKFYTEQLQIGNGALEPGNGRNEKFVAWSNNGSLVMSYYDARKLPMGHWAEEFTLADHFFHAAYGGSFLNHQFLIAAEAPVWAQPLPAQTGFVSQWDVKNKRLRDAHLTLDGRHVVNTTFPAQGPRPRRIPRDQLLNAINDTDPDAPGYTPTIGDRLDEKGISWRWYSGGWDDALHDRLDAKFQYHHQPFAYFARYAPFDTEGHLRPETTGPAAHLQDESRFLEDVRSGKLPSVSFVKPIGEHNEHPGYANPREGQNHVAELLQTIRESPYWDKTAVIVTYDENGGRWDHVPPPRRDEWGPGTRVPTLILSPLARRHYIDHTPYDTLSILRTLEVRFALKPLNQRDAGANGLTCAFR